MKWRRLSLSIENKNKINENTLIRTVEVKWNEMCAPLVACCGKFENFHFTQNATNKSISRLFVSPEYIYVIIAEFSGYTYKCKMEIGCTKYKNKIMQIMSRVAFVLEISWFCVRHYGIVFRVEYESTKFQLSMCPLSFTSSYILCDGKHKFGSHCRISNWILVGIQLYPPAYSILQTP